MATIKTLKISDINFKSSIIYIIGPTAIGKSNLSMELALQLNCDIISADAYQVYTFMDIGTAKPTQLEQRSIKHHLIDIRFPDENYNVTNFINLTKAIIEEKKEKEKNIIICGGNGLFLRAFLYNYTFPKAKSDPAIRKQLELEYEMGNQNKLWDQLNTIDSLSAKKIHPNNKHHLLRALEIYLITGTSPSQLKNHSQTIRNDTEIIGLNSHRSVVKDNIDVRVDKMIHNGLINEVENLIKKGYKPNLPALNCIGYKEVISFLAGNLNKEDMISYIKRNTYLFSKRQMTWFNKIDNVNWI